MTLKIFTILVGDFKVPFVIILIKEVEETIRAPKVTNTPMDVLYMPLEVIFRRKKALTLLKFTTKHPLVDKKIIFISRRTIYRGGLVRYLLSEAYVPGHAKG